MTMFHVPGGQMVSGGGGSVKVEIGAGDDR